MTHTNNKHTVLKDRIRARKLFSEKEAVTTALSVIDILENLRQENADAVCTNIVADNIVLTTENGQDKAEMIDTSVRRLLSDDNPPLASNSNICQAPEYFHGKFTVVSEVYAVGALLYEMLFGIEPWAIDVEMLEASIRTLILLKMKRKPLLVPAMNGGSPSPEMMNIISKATDYQPERRFQTLSELRVELVKLLPAYSGTSNAFQRNIRCGKGFADVAGMDVLKEKIRYDIIDVLKESERAKELGITIPNGILLYGPPGCGKTFFAEKCAEEMQCHFMYVKCSDVASPYIHGGQEKIARLFDEAKTKAPALIFLDEVDALLRKRTKQQSASESGEINEFLCQINNCGESGVFVIAATNMPEEIDEAALRAGRLEQKYYIGVPDTQTIEKLLQLQLSCRKCEEVDVHGIARLLQGRVAADVKMVVDVAARMAFRNHCCISDKLLKEAVGNTQPSVEKAVLDEHLRIKEKFERKQGAEKRKRIGFQ